MPRFLIERHIQGVGKTTAEELARISKTSTALLEKMGPQVQWVESYVTDNKVYSVWIAPTEEMIHQHAVAGGFVVTTIKQIHATIGPTLADELAL